MDNASTTADGMRSRRTSILIGLLAIVTVGAGVWWTWRWCTSPRVPEFNLADADPEVVKEVHKVTQVARARPFSSDSWGELGMVLLANKFEAEAVLPLSHAERFEPDNPRWPYLQGIALLGRDPNAAIPCLARAVTTCQQHPKSLPNGLAAAQLRLAETLVAEGRLEEARDYYKAIPDGPLAPCADFGLGVLANIAGNAEAASQYFTAAAKSPLTRQKATTQLASLAHRQKSESAKAIAEQASQMPSDPRWPDPFLKECLEKLVGKESRVQHATQLEQQGDVEEALRTLRLVTEDYPEAQSFLTYGIVAGRRGLYQESENALRRSLKLEPNLLRAQYYLSLALFAQGEQFLQRDQTAATEKLEEAAHWAKRATQLSPRYGEAHFQLGLTLYILKQPDEAIHAFRQAVATRPEITDSHLWLGRILAEQGHHDQAEMHLVHAQKYAASNDPRPKQLLDKLRESNP